MQGFLNVNKPAGPTSHDIVNGVRRMLPRGTRVGHAGTLDPFAQGVLVICVGEICRLASLVMGQEKRYVTTIVLGAASDTDDRTGQITPVSEAVPERQQVEQVLGRFIGEISQVPPNHSAALVDGRRAYRIARAGEQPALEAKTVSIREIHLLAYEYPLLKLEIVCGSGTYIRALARDVGRTLGVGGYCTELSRTASGAFTLERATLPDALDIVRDLISPLVAVEHLAKVSLTQSQVEDVLLGRRVAADVPAREVAMLTPAGELLALGKTASDGRIQPTKVLVNTHALRDK